MRTSRRSVAKPPNRADLQLIFSSAVLHPDKLFIKSMIMIKMQMIFSLLKRKKRKRMSRKKDSVSSTIYIYIDFSIWSLWVFFSDDSIHDIYTVLWLIFAGLCDHTEQPALGGCFKSYFYPRSRHRPNQLLSLVICLFSVIILMIVTFIKRRCFIEMTHGTLQNSITMTDLFQSLLIQHHGKHTSRLKCCRGNVSQY